METCRELAIASLSSDGRGIAARAPDEPVTFVAGALPGETVLVQIMADRKRFREARAIEILSQAPDAAEPCCPHATECGGCPLMRMAYPAQLTWKRRIVQDAFVRIGHLEGVQAAPVLPSPLTDGFRNKMELAFGLDAEGRLCLGMRRRSGHDIIATPQCRLMDAQARTLACAVEAACARERLSVYEPDTAEASPACGSGPCDRRGRGGRGGQQGSREQGKGFLRFCQIRSGIVPDEACTGFAMPGQGQQAYWILLVTSRGADAETATLRRIARELLDAFPALHAVIHEERKACDFLRQGDRRSFALCRQGEIPEAARLLAPLGERRYLIDCAGFFQVNTRSAEKLAELAGQGLVSGNLLDLYCGAGAPGLSLVSGGRVTGVEYAASSVASARLNAERMGIPARFLAGDVTRLLPRALREAKARQALCDPPRAGLTLPVASALLDSDLERIVYISCNPATLARDLQKLAEGFDIVQATPVDLFPHTPHVETVVHLQRAGTPSATR